MDTSAVAVADPGSRLPPSWQQGTFMEIFVRAYQDSDGDGIGDLRGLISRLDYLQDLGITGLWLMPIMPSQDRDHGYAVTDYRAIAGEYGSLEDFDELLQQAHARGIGIIIDYVMNHSAARHPAFVNSRDADLTPYRDWYVWQDFKPAGWSIYGGDPWHASSDASRRSYFAAFWDQMPDFNLRNPEVVQWHHDNLRFWLNRGVDGFRFDAVGNLVENGARQWENQPENYALMGEVRALVARYQYRYIVCEAPADPLGFAATTSCGSAFAFGRQSAFVGAAKGNRGSIEAVAELLRTTAPGLAVMVSNHDSFAGQRLYDQVGGNLAQYKLAAATYLLQSAPAFVYYGEEVGMAGAAALDGDPRLRTPMSWESNRDNGGFTTGKPFRALSKNVATFNVQAQMGDSDSLHSYYRALLTLRTTVPALSQGATDQVVVDDLVLGFRRTLGGDHAVVAINYGKGEASAVIDSLPPGALLTRIFPVGAATVSADGAGQAIIALEPLQVAIFRY